MSNYLAHDLTDYFPFFAGATSCGGRLRERSGSNRQSDVDLQSVWDHVLCRYGSSVRQHGVAHDGQPQSHAAGRGPRESSTR